LNEFFLIFYSYLLASMRFDVTCPDDNSAIIGHAPTIHDEQYQALDGIRFVACRKTQQT
jgi:hypothetical protein